MCVNCANCGVEVKEEDVMRTSWKDFCPTCFDDLFGLDDTDYDDEDYDDDRYFPGEEMDGDHASALASAGWGTDEDYGDYRDYDGMDYDFNMHSEGM